MEINRFIKSQTPQSFKNKFLNISLSFYVLDNQNQKDTQQLIRTTAIFTDTTNIVDYLISEAISKIKIETMQ